MATIERAETQAQQISSATEANVPRKYRVTLSSANQITLPKDIREALDLKPADTLFFTAAGDDRFYLAKQRSLREEMVEWRSQLSERSDRLIKKMAGLTAEQYHEVFDNLPENVELRKQRYGV